MGEQVWDKGKYIKGEKASCQIRTERRTKASFKKVERSTHGPGRPVHTVSSEEEDVTTSVSDTTAFISKFGGSKGVVVVVVVVVCWKGGCRFFCQICCHSL